MNNDQEELLPRRNTMKFLILPIEMKIPLFYMERVFNSVKIADKDDFLIMLKQRYNR